MNIFRELGGYVVADKRYDGIAAMAALSGLSREEVEAQWTKVRENARLLELCGGPHDIGPIDHRDEYRCGQCGGVLLRQQAIWYLRGVAHGRRRE